MMLFGNFNVNRLKYSGVYETQLKEPSTYDLLRRDVQIWTGIKMQQAYDLYNSDATQNTFRRVKNFFTRQKTELSEGLVKYNNFVFWWKADSEKYGSSFRRYWRFNRAVKEGVFDFYLSTMMVICGLTMLYGLYRGNKKRGKFTHQEKVNELKLADLELEMERLKILMEMDEIDE